MTLKAIIASASLAAGALAVAGSASATTYTGTRDVGGNTVQLSITTDGVVGDVAATDIDSFAVSSTGPIGNFSFSSGQSGVYDFLNGNADALVATSSALSYNIVYPNFLVLARLNSDTDQYNDYEIGTTLADGNTGEIVSGGIGGGSVVEGTTESGLVTIATASAAPEPGTWAFLIAGIAMIGCMMRSRGRGQIGAVGA